MNPPKIVWNRQGPGSAAWFFKPDGSTLLTGLFPAYAKRLSVGGAADTPASGSLLKNRPIAGSYIRARRSYNPVLASRC